MKTTKKQIANCKLCEKLFSYWLSVRPKAIYCSRLCQNTLQARVQQEKYRLKINNLTDMEKLEYLKNAFEKHVVKKEGCWGWNGFKTKGYARVHYLGNSMPAHRASYIIYNTSIFNDLFILHKCDNRECTNPEHLFIGTQKDNLDDMYAKNRDNPAKGERARASVLNKEQVIEIRRLLDIGVMGTRIAKDFNVHPTTINDIKHRRIWKHIP